MSCPKDCHEKKKNKCCGLAYVELPAALGDDTGEFKPENGAYSNTIVKYVANGAIYIYAGNGVYVKIKEGEK